MRLRSVLCVALAAGILVACGPQEEPITASTTAGRFAGHRQLDDVQPAPPGGQVIEETQDADPVVFPGGCLAVRTTYGTQASVEDVARFYRSQGFDDGYEDFATYPRADRETGQIDTHGEILRWKGTRHPGDERPYRELRAVDAAWGPIMGDDEWASYASVVVVERPNCRGEGG